MEKPFGNKSENVTISFMALYYGQKLLI